GWRSEPAQLHHAARRRGSVAARGASAARADAPDRRADDTYGERSRSSGLGNSAQRGASKVRLGAGSQCLDYRWSAGDPNPVWAFAAELVARAPDVILCSGAPATAVLQRATHTVPIVFVQIADPVGSGRVPILEGRGGNVTGFIHFEHAMIGKWLEALK